MACLYKKGRTFWVQYYRDGKRIQQSLKTRDKAEAKYLTNEIENKLAAGEHIQALTKGKKMAEDCFEDFMKHREGRLKARTIRTDNYRIQRFLKDEKVRSLQEITEAFLKHHLDRRMKEDKISPTTANHTIRVFKTFLNFCTRSKYISENPIQHMKKYPINSKPQRFLSRDEIGHLIASVKGHRLEPFIRVALYTGMRLGEAERLNWEDIDFKKNIITVPLSKSGKFRVIPLHPQLKAFLEPMAGKNGSVLGMNSGVIEKAFRGLRAQLKAKGMKHFRIHDLRHTFASLLIMANVDIVTVSKLLGHGNIKTTQIYAHLYDDHVKDAMNKLEL